MNKPVDTELVLRCVDGKDSHTVESGYNEHGYNHIPAIEQSFLGTKCHPVIFNIIKYKYNKSGSREISL